MDTRRLLSATAVVLAVPLLPACALLRPDAPPAISPLVAAEDAGEPIAVTAAEPQPVLPTPPPTEATPTPVPPGPVVEGQAALSAANADARTRSRSDAFVGGVQVFSWAPGRVYEVWTAPLRVTTLTLAAGEAVTALAAGDTVRWQIAQSASGGSASGEGAAGATSRFHVLIKPLEAGLETNLVLTTTARVYLVHLRSTRAANGFNTAVTWTEPDQRADVAPEPLRLSPVTPQGAIHARYRVSPHGRTPDWAPIAVFDDGTRTFVTLGPDARRRESPALFVISAAGEAELVNYRQAEGVLIVDRLFDQAELRLGAGRRAEVVRLVRLEAER